MKKIFYLLIVCCLASCDDPAKKQADKLIDPHAPNQPLNFEQTKERRAQQAMRLAKQSKQPPTAKDFILADERYNGEGVIPPQCYTKTESQYNPCYVCHQSYPEDSKRSNIMRDGGLQGLYAFSDLGVKNHWQNLFKDRSKEIASIADEKILTYVRQDNYSALVEWMKSEAWSGQVLELNNLQLAAKAFDQHGMALDNSRWVAFNYKPMPSTFWPTNGSTDDVMIRLAKDFYSINGQYSRDVYYANLALVEMAISGSEKTTIIPLDENNIQQDVNGDGRLDNNVTDIIKQTHYFGDAKDQLVRHMLYPKDTEFLHSVRYIDIKEGGKIGLSARMKELRYMKKIVDVDMPEIAQSYYREEKEKYVENLPQVADFGDRGIENGFGWMILGFIEDKQGQLRKQSDEEQFFCAGCHKTIGTTIDQTFSFPRKVAGAEGWQYIDITKIQDVANLNETEGEYLTYMSRVGGGDEFRQNKEMIEKWFDKQGQINKQKVQQQGSIYDLIAPSVERALKLNKAYFLTVKEQSYIFGRDAVLNENTNVYKEIDESIPPLKPEHRYQWDIRLHWK